jgi:diguanylate cyclase (GGDEF)-like protein
MSFRARLITFFVLIVVVPMTAMGVLVFGLIDGSVTGKADARAAGIADTVAGFSRSASRDAAPAARTAARELALVPADRLSEDARRLARRLGLARIEVRVGDRPPVSVGDRGAIAPAVAVVRAAGGRPPRTVTVARLTATGLVHRLAGVDTGIVVRQGARTLGASDRHDARIASATSPATVAAGGHRYRTASLSLTGFGRAPVRVIVLSDLAATGAATTRDRLLAAGVIAAFLVLAFFFTLLASRGLRAQVMRFLEAARRLGSGDFSSPVKTVGHDEFAALGAEFNAMSRQLQDRLEQLERERARFRASVRRIGDAFASGLDRNVLLELALRTALDATEADRGRVSARHSAREPLVEIGHVGGLSGLQTALAAAERQALERGVGEGAAGAAHLAAVALGEIGTGGPAHGVITVCREGRPFTTDDLELLRSLATRATLALANVNMHHDVARQAVTDDLTGLASHGQFQARLETELREADRYGTPVAVAMFDLDNFKSVNDSHGHPQGDLVLRRVAEVLRGTCRDTDIAARYGGEELALILPQTDLEGVYELAERARTAIEQLAIPRTDHRGWLRITASIGVAAVTGGSAEALVAAADAALYTAKREGKNRTVRADRPLGAAVGARELAGSTGGSFGE